MNWQWIPEGLRNTALQLWQYVSNPWIAGAGILVLVLLALLIWLMRRQPSRVRAFHNDKGYVDISRMALVEMVRSTCEQIDIEKKPGVAIRCCRGRLHIDVRIRLLSTRKLTEVSGILQGQLIEMLEQGLGIRKLGSINVIVTGIRLRSGKESRAELPLRPSEAGSPAALAYPSANSQDQLPAPAESELEPESPADEQLRRTESH
jgi:uncharacterized alkaline shock family protein YloU